MLAIFSGVESPILDKSPWDSIAIFIFFLSFLGSLLKQCILFEIFLQFSLPPPYAKLKLRNNSGYTRPTLFVRWREGLDLSELENAPEMQVSQDFCPDCRGLYQSSQKEKETRCLVFTPSIKRENIKFHVVVLQWRQRNVQKAWSTCSVVVLPIKTYCCEVLILNSLNIYLTILS